MSILGEANADQQLHRLPAEPPAGLSAEAAYEVVLAAQAEFAETEHRGAALKIFNRRVSYWSNQFTDKRLKRFAYTLGSQMDGETHSFHITIDKLRRQHRKLHPDAYVNKATGKPRMLSKRQIQRYVDELETKGIITVDRDQRQDETGDYPNMREANAYTVHFGRVIRAGEVRVHDFMAADRRKQRKNVTKDVCKGATKDAAKDVRSTYSPTGSSTSSTTSSSSPLRGNRDDEAAAGMDLSGEGASARACGGIAPAETRPPAETAPPGGGAPAATASRAERDHADDEVMGLAQELERASDGDIIPRMILGKLRTLCQAYGFAVVDQAMSWVSSYGPEHLPGPGAEDFGAVFNWRLEDMVLAYIAARNEQAAELGEDPAGFDLVEHLDQERERAEREAVEQQAQAEALRKAQLAELKPVIRELAALCGATYDEIALQAADLAERRDGDLSEVLATYKEYLAKEREQAHRGAHPDH